MLGFGNSRRRTRNNTFSSNRIRGAALAGLGMLAWKWWRNRQTSDRPSSNPTKTFSEGSTEAGGSF